jgi:hypothetical protein
LQTIFKNKKIKNLFHLEQSQIKSQKTVLKFLFYFDIIKTYREKFSELFDDLLQFIYLWYQCYQIDM